MQKIQNTYPVISNIRVCSEFYRLSLDAKPLVEKVRPGQFLHIRINEGLEPFFRRPFSVHRAGKHLEILYEVVGLGTAMLSGKKRGDRLDILGPLGNSFSLPPRDTKTVIMVAGGMGAAPLLFLSDVLKKKNYHRILLYGARNREHLFSMKAFKENGCEVRISTDDGSVGLKGRVTGLLSTLRCDPRTTIIYTCGPRPMMAGVQRFAEEQGISGQASCEEVMACGLGACLGCSIKTVSGYKTVCHDGPIFDFQEVVFDAL